MARYRALAGMWWQWDGIRVIRRTGVKVNPLTHRMWLSPSLSVNYMPMGEQQSG